MAIFRVSLLVILMLLLVGCATTSSEGKYTVVETTQRKDYQESDPPKHFSGIKAVSLNGSKIMLQLVDKSLFEEYSVPLITYLHEYHSETHLIKGFLKTTVVLPIYLVFSPLFLISDNGRNDFSNFFRDYTWKSIFGYSEKKIRSPVANPANKVKTGKSEWRDLQKTHKILISGFDKDYERSINWGEAEYDLSPYILNTDITKTTTIKITCLDCDLLGQDEQQAIYKDTKKAVEIIADFRNIKTNLLTNTEKSNLRQTESDKKTVIKKAEQDRNIQIVKPEKILIPNPNTGKLE